MAGKTLRLRGPDTCVACGAELAVGTEAVWDGAVRTVTCLACHDTGDLTAVAEGPSPDPAPIDVGTPGASAQAEYVRRHAKREARLEAKWGTGRLGRLAKILSDDPQHTRAWARGAGGELQLAETLHRLLGDTCVLLHDRRVPGKRSNIDHLAVAASGVWVIDTKRYAGRIEVRDVGGWFRTDRRLYVRGSDKSKLVAAMTGQVAVVRTALGEDGTPVRPALAFVDGEWAGLRGKPFQIDDVWVSRPTKLAELISEPGPLDPSDVERIARRLAAELPTA